MTQVVGVAAAVQVAGVVVGESFDVGVEPTARSLGGAAHDFGIAAGHHDGRVQRLEAAGSGISSGQQPGHEVFAVAAACEFALAQGFEFDGFGASGEGVADPFDLE